MNKFKTNSKRRNRLGLLLILMPVICIFIAMGWISIKRFEGEKPVVKINPDFSYINKSINFNLSSQDYKSGLKSIVVELSQGDKNAILYKKDFQGGSFSPQKNIKEDNVVLTIKPAKLGFIEGKATLQIGVSDFSWRNIFKGNLTALKKEIVIDSISPAIGVLTKAHNIAPGGSGLVIYRLNEIVERTGVVIDDKFYPGCSGYFKDPFIYLSFFALDYNKKNVDKLYVTATDKAGNNSVAGFYYHIIKKNYSKDRLNITDNFLNMKLPEFERYVEFDENLTNIEKYIKINTDFRKDTYDIISKLSNETDKVLYWSGPFLRFKGSPMARFADDRTYLYNGQIIDRQTHMGVDIASLEHAPVPAANRGKVVYAGPAGIYGYTVVIDHGFGLFSLYGHLSSIAVKKGEIVKKGDIIGNSGMTGLAGGDHLHFAMIVNSTYVNPVEWWDENWIVNNITSKLDEVSSTVDK